MKRIEKYCRNLHAAETFQNRLYNRYDHVRLIASPLLTESGFYKWEVK